MEGFSSGMEEVLVFSKLEAEEVEVVLDEVEVFLGLGSFLRISFVRAFSKVFARAFISVVKMTGSSLGLTFLCLSTHS